MDTKILVAAFARKGFENNSESVKTAKEIESALKNAGLDCNEFLIVPTETYPEDPEEFKAVTITEKETRTRPEIIGKYSGMDKVTDIILVTPNWWNSVPMAVLTFFDGYDFNNKRVYPVVLHEGDGGGKILDELRDFLPKTDVMPVIEINGGEDASVKINKLAEDLK